MAESLDIHEAVARSGFSAKTIYRAIADGELPAKKVRSRWRISGHDLDRWLLVPVSAGAHVIAPRAVAPDAVGSRAALRSIESGG